MEEICKNLREYLDITAQVCPEFENLKGEGMGSKKGIDVRGVLVRVETCQEEEN